MWKLVERPGYFGRRKEEKINHYNSLYGKDNWALHWVVDSKFFSFIQACVLFYERSYLCYLKDREEDLKYISSFCECIDNSFTNIQSRLDYNYQESYATHIQDIAVRNTIVYLGYNFDIRSKEVLVIRSTDSNGYRFSPGKVPFIDTSLINQPSLRPKWADEGSVEDFWQSNKWVCVREDSNDNSSVVSENLR